jgi:hypothetical protein
VSSRVTIIEPKNKNDYGKWNAKWWQWALSLPKSAHPLYDTADVSEGQNGDVWFIGSGFESGNVVERTITIPYGTKLFVPLFNIEASTVEGNGKGNELATAADTWMKYVIVTTPPEIDGTTVNYYRAPSSVFKFGPLPEDNVLKETFGVIGATEGTISQSAANGYYMMIAPLEPGKSHTIKWSSTWAPPDTTPFDQEVTYTVFVEPTNQGGKK